MQQYECHRAWQSRRKAIAALRVAAFGRVRRVARLVAEFGVGRCRRGPAPDSMEAPDKCRSQQYFRCLGRVDNPTRVHHLMNLSRKASKAARGRRNHRNTILGDLRPRALWATSWGGGVTRRARHTAPGTERTLYRLRRLRRSEAPDKQRSQFNVGHGVSCSL